MTAGKRWSWILARFFDIVVAGWIGLTLAGLVIDWDYFTITYFDPPATISDEELLRRFLGIPEPDDSWAEPILRYLRFGLHIITLEYSYFAESSQAIAGRIAVLSITVLALASLFIRTAGRQGEPTIKQQTRA